MMPETMEALGVDSFDAAQALYWYCADHHDGQWSDLYRILSTLPYTPGASERGPSSYAADAVYDALSDGAVDPQALRDWIDAKYAAEHAEHAACAEKRTSLGAAAPAPFTLPGARLALGKPA